ncbi:SufD family Fe-S cluster assembly protein [Candidatus Peregrinibacteria bacterium]|nr:SufD family Fe-S cluster assembly protein [Candidatus Peregrinibacteria bacterium]
MPIPFDILAPETRGITLKVTKGGYTLTLAANRTFEGPILIKFRPTDKNLNISLSVTIGKNAKATIVEEWPSDVRPATINYDVRIAANEKSDLRWITIQNVAKTSIMAEKRKTTIGNKAEVNIYSFDFGAKRLESHCEQSIGAEAECNLTSVARTQGTQHFDIICDESFTGKSGRGEIRCKGVAQDTSHLKFGGLLTIEKTAGGTQAYLKQETLNLSSKAKVSATPALNIKTNDVKAGHGASIRNLSPEELFYLASRGINEKMGKKMLTEAFLKEVLNELADLPDVQKRVTSFL